MTYDQLIAWFAIEGYQAWNWKDPQLRRDGSPYTLAKAGEEQGYVVTPSGGCNAYPVKFKEEEVFPLDTVDEVVLRSIYARLSRSIL